MQELLDIRTLSINNIIISLSFALSLIIYAKYHPNYSGIKTIGCAFLLSSSAFIMLGLRGYFPDLLSILLTNILLVLSMGLINIGFGQFYQRDIRSMIHKMLFLLIVSIACAFWFSYINKNLNIRIIILSLVLSLQCAFIAQTLWLACEKQKYGADFFIVILYVFLSIFFAFRSLTTLTEQPLVSFMDAGAMHKAALIIYQMLVMCTCFGVIWLVSSRMQKDLHDQATHDPLTQVYNRRALEDIVGVEHSRSMRSKTPLSVIMLDIDHFKKINDRYGHARGDEVLREIAKTLGMNTRGHDSIARFGGEEFIILLPDTHINKATILAEKLRAKLESCVYRFKQHSAISVTASFGVTECDLGKEEWQSVVERVDSALYLAKESGRNRVIVYAADNQDAGSSASG